MMAVNSLCLRVYGDCQKLSAQMKRGLYVRRMGPSPILFHPPLRNTIDDPSSITQRPSYDSGEYSGTSGIVTNMSDVRAQMELLLIDAVPTGGAETNTEQAGINSTAETDLDSSHFPTRSENDAEGSIPPRSAGLATLVDAVEHGAEPSVQGTSTGTGTIIAEENAMLFGVKNGDGVKVDGEK
jgi:hypothetical protein